MLWVVVVLEMEIKVCRVCCSKHMAGCPQVQGAEGKSLQQAVAPQAQFGFVL